MVQHVYSNIMTSEIGQKLLADKVGSNTCIINIFSGEAVEYVNTLFYHNVIMLCAMYKLVLFDK